MDKYECKRDKNGFDYINVSIVRNDKEYIFKTLVRTGADHTIFSARELNVDITGLKKIQAIVGIETIDVYEVHIDSIAIGDKDKGKLIGMNCVYVSELKYFEEKPVLGMDYLSKMNYYRDSKSTVLEFDAKEFF